MSEINNWKYLGIALRVAEVSATKEAVRLSFELVKLIQLKGGDLTLKEVLDAKNENELHFTNEGE